MGAWSTRVFEDDELLDWLGDLTDQRKPLEFFEECLDLEGIDDLDYTACAGVLGTSVMVDALLHGPTADMPEEATAWLIKNKKLQVAGLAPRCVAGLDRLLGDSSELNALWMENAELYPRWKTAILVLRGRLATA